MLPPPQELGVADQTIVVLVEARLQRRGGMGVQTRCSGGAVGMKRRCRVDAAQCGAGADLQLAHRRLIELAPQRARHLL